MNSFSTLWLPAGILIVAVGCAILTRLIFKNNRIIKQITEHEQALIEKDKILGEAVESVSEGFVIYDQNDCLMSCNEAYRKLYQISDDLLIPGNSFSEIIRAGVERGQYPAAVGNEEDWIAERIRLHQDPDGGIVQQRLDNGTWLQIIEHKTKSGYIVGNRVDITALKRGEAELRLVKEGLEEQVLERTGALLEAKEYAEQANRTKSEFLTNMSHELRTPLHGLMSFSEMGKSRVQVLDREKIGRYFENIHISGKRLLVLVNDLLDFSRLDAGKFRLEFSDCNLETIWQQVTRELDSLATKKGINFEYQALTDDTACYCDHQRIQQVIANILSNAIKFSPDNSTVRCEVESTLLKLEGEKEVDAIQVTIGDEGEGVRKEDLELIFEKFTQVTDAKNAIQGTGLGLAICKELLHLHRGQIWAENNPGPGMRFIFVIPTKMDDSRLDSVESQQLK